MIGKLNMDPIDNVSRDSKDGTYRCPQCQTPFTRRSNLRRHFQIHLRGSSLKCEVCNEEHSTKDSLQDHVTASHSAIWNVTHEKPQRIVIPQDIPPSNPHSPFASVSPPSFGPFSSQNGSAGQYPSLASPAPARAFQVPNFGRLNLGSSSTASTTAILPRPASSLTSDRNIAMHGASPRINPFSHRRSNTSSSSISSSPISPSSPYTRLGQPGPQQGHYGVYPPSQIPSLLSHQDWIADVMGQQIMGHDGDERPIYTRQQVKNMLDVVSDCFIESVIYISFLSGKCLEQRSASAEFY
ncbi:hypothetical protein BYT27DRAFT_6669752 [Phlegmacium glaucopus]|nr:hypothetical protein BYT27DRAFT_6669752 [Phlegmacium glaucopus]